MSLLTPFGPLQDIPLDNIEQLKEILVRSDKSRMLEGLVIESVFNEYLSKLTGQGIDVLPISLVRTLTVKAQRHSTRKTFVNAWWVWDHSEECTSAAALCRLLSPKGSHEGFLFDCYYGESARDFFIKEWNGETHIPIQSFMLKNRRQTVPQFRIPAASVIDEHRSQQAFWAGISSQYSDDLFKRVVLHRLFKNCAIQPFFDGVWDIDSLARLPDNTFMQLEVKHKFPRVTGPDENLSFGINNGQLMVMLALAQRGIKTLHMIMVKPIWNKNLGTGYLLNRIGDRKNVVLLAKLLDETTLREIMKRRSSATGAEQSFTGKDEQKARYVTPSEFQFLGTLDDPVEAIAKNIHLAATGHLDRPASDQMLKNSRIQQ
ncbi:hypothetical protein CZ787_14335 [Halomonas citrativorans]|uniref:Uncharacterized protein n=1 Tax=Halomonas citrativorans TaxID=2742612 RepID=A0A1R4I3H5_9GAMM|nr:hypothetical protein [Halomonas citrativorans]SJN14276.1 hypothetical protein CZ787_14335 [Halomonas citrativorans]